MQEEFVLNEKVNVLKVKTIKLWQLLSVPSICFLYLIKYMKGFSWQVNEDKKGLGFLW